MRSHDRHLNKIFDKGRSKMLDKGGCTGCDLHYHVREQVMGVGKCTRGGLKQLNTTTAKVIQANLDIDMTSNVNRKISSVLEDRGKTESAFEGDNHFHNLRGQQKKRKNFSDIMKADNESIKGGQQDQVSHISGKKCYYHRHSKASQGKIMPVLAKSSERHQYPSKLTTLTNTSTNFRTDLKSRINPLDDDLLRKSV